MDMLIDGRWTGPPRTATAYRFSIRRPVRQLEYHARRHGERRRSRRRRGTGRRGGDGGHAGLAALRDARSQSPAASRPTRQNSARFSVARTASALARRRARSASPPAFSAATPRKPSASSGAPSRSTPFPGREKSLALTMRRPLGVVAAIVPFNYPVELWSHKVAGGLAAGNAVITKAPEDCPLTMAEIARYLEEEGLPRAGASVPHRRRRRRRGACPAPGVQMIAMTGSTAAGRRILEAAAPDPQEGPSRTRRQRRDHRLRATPTSMRPRTRLSPGRFTSGNGQICCAVKRVLVERSGVTSRLLAAV